MSDAPLVLIVANPYEGEMCRRALAEIGVRLELAEGGEGARELLEQGERPLVMILADGLFSEDAKELCYVARQRFAHLPVFLLADREGAGGGLAAVERTFLRPVATDELAHAVEKLAVAAESAADAVEINAAFDNELSATGEAAAADAEWNVSSVLTDGWETPSVVRALPRLPEVHTEVVMAPRPSARDHSYDDSDLDAAFSEPLGAPPASITLGRVERMSDQLLRADDALSDPADLMGRVAEAPLPTIDPSYVGSLDELADAPLPSLAADSARLASTGAVRPPLSQLRRLDQDLSAAERRLFPDAGMAGGTPARAYPDEESLDDIDLDTIGVDTPPRRSDHKSAPTRAEPPPMPSDEPLRARPAASTKAPVTLDELVEESGELGDLDLVELLARLHAAAFTGRLTLTRGDGQKSLFFDGGAPVAATSSLTHDRLGDQLFREGKLTREQHALTREVESSFGRRGAQALVDLTLLKPAELFGALRRQTEEICYSLFTSAWDHASYRLSPEEAGSDDKLRLSLHPFALLTEGVRRKYGLEQLVERLGPPETVLTPTDRFTEVLPDMALSPAEKLAAEMIDGHRSLGEIRLAVGGLPTLALSEGGLYALGWVLWCVAAVRVGEAASPVDATSWRADPDEPPERRRLARPSVERPEDRAVDRERIRAKWQQLGDCDYFAALGVERDATEHEILRAYERLRTDFAPDRFVEPLRLELAPAFEEIAEILDEARRVLLDAPLRHTYRSQLLAGSVS